MNLEESIEKYDEYVLKIKKLNIGNAWNSPIIMHHEACTDFSWKGYSYENKDYYFSGSFFFISHKRMKTAKISVEHSWDGTETLFVRMGLYGNTKLSRWWNMVSPFGALNVKNFDEAIETVQQILDMTDSIYGGKK